MTTGKAESCAWGAAVLVCLGIYYKPRAVKRDKWSLEYVFQVPEVPNVAYVRVGTRCSRARSSADAMCVVRY